ncbi:30S ribosomal protein S2 [candidate division WWE3 bacterium CG_4_9_14_3_um_filter_34_6]|uniref:Small ribosomal subunit protein uS2 n=1 Tax=candidate division WWE3 bacterium CG_4_9_14_3_um_filter_34_6 TaxID=1975079 RepID=A0A2M7X474_UNCKA|nr:MAG: 30S ribosomal protein S2 [candidate division WWE3 bacterium CG_4_9_14_3_um_filter_34_6]
MAEKLMLINYKLPTIEEMLENGVHFGHQVRRQNPIMNKFVYQIEKKSHVIDLYQTKEMLEKARDFLYEVAKSGKQIIIVGTKRQASPSVEKYAKQCGALFVNQRWLGGTLTNFDSIKGNWTELQRFQKGMEEGEFKHYTKKEQLLIERKIEKLDLLVGGIQNMEKFPGAVVIIDVKRERTAVREANALNIPVVGIVDTNSSLEGIAHVIPANDDAIKSIELLLAVIADAISKGVIEKGRIAEKAKESKDKEERKEVIAEKKIEVVEKEKAKRAVKVAKKTILKKAETKKVTKAKPKSKVVKKK